MLRSWSAVLVLPLSVALAGGCTDDPPKQTPPAAATPAVVDGSSSMNDGPGEITCEELATAVEYGTLMEAGVVDTIVTSAKAADAPIADGAAKLGTAYRTATESHGTEEEPDAIAAVSAAGATLMAVCDESAPDSVG